MKCKIMYSEVIVLFLAMNPVFIYFCTLLWRLHLFLSFETATRRLDVILQYCINIVFIIPTLLHICINFAL